MNLPFPIADTNGPHVVADWYADHNRPDLEAQFRLLAERPPTGYWFRSWSWSRSGSVSWSGPRSGSEV